MPQGKRGIAQEPAPPFPSPPALRDFKEHLHLSIWHKGKQLAGYSSGFLFHGANDTGVLDLPTWSPAAPGTRPLHPAAALLGEGQQGQQDAENGRERGNEPGKTGRRGGGHTHTKKKSGKGKARLEVWRQEPLLPSGARGFSSMLLTTISKLAGPRSSTPPRSGHASPSQPPSWQPTGPPAKPLPSASLTFSADCDVPKNIGMKANHTMQVVYMVNPMGLASLKVSGTPRVLIAYTVQVTMRSMLYPSKQMRERSEMSHLRMPRAKWGFVVRWSS